MTSAETDLALLATFAKLADTLVADFDIVDLLQVLVDSCAELLDISAAGILLADDNGDLELVASTSEASRLVEVMQISADAGPCIESFQTGVVVAEDDIADAPERWRAFSDSALAQGFRSVHAIPLRLRETVIGTLNLLRTETGVLPTHAALAAQAFADVATIALLQERALRESNLVREQLQVALSSRVVIEQAKGVVAHRRGIRPSEAFDVIRRYARANSVTLSWVAEEVVELRLEL